MRMPIRAIKDMGLKTFHGYLKQIDGMLAGREWFSDRYSVLDPYGFVFYTWGVRRELPMAELKNYTALKDRLLKRPAVSACGRGREDQGVGAAYIPRTSSWPGLTPPSTSLILLCHKDVDARHKSLHLGSPEARPECRA